MSHAFTELHLHPHLVQAVTELGYTDPTPIQSAVIPILLAGQDVLGQAHTGTGKTAAFALPLLHALSTAPRERAVHALILVPTRELALQVAQAITAYGCYTEAQVLAVYGGQPYSQQLRRLREGVDIVVGTPGRILDLIQRTALELGKVRTVILDEADEMFSMGFIDDLEAILQATPARRQTALFSATLPPAVRRLAERHLQNPRSVVIQPQQRTLTATEQRYYLVHEAEKLAALTRLFEVEAMTSTLIFVRTRVGTGELAAELSGRGFPAEALNGDLSQDAREQVLQRFRQHQLTVLVATDVAARGLDIEGISHVVNYDMPHDPETYVHRIGRTGRAGKSGVAMSLLTPSERWRVRQIEAYTRQKMLPATLPSDAEIYARRDAVLVERMQVWLQRGRYRREREMVTELVAAGSDPLDIAAAALKIARAEETRRPLAPVTPVPEVLAPRRGREPRRGSRRPERHHAGDSRDAGMVRLMLNAGKTHGIRPNDVVGTIAYHANIPGHTIGAIRIHDNHTLVDVPQQLVEQVLSKAGKYQIRKRPITVACAS